MATSKKQKRLSKPNILITGTPCTGKSYLCKAISEKLDMNWMDCSKLAKENNFLEEDYDSVLDCPIIDEDKLLDYMEPIMQKGNNLVEYHSSDFFPERWFDGVFVTTTENKVLYDRLVERGYNQQKVASNLDCEIFRVVLDEAKSAYKDEIVHELVNNNEEDGKKNIQIIIDWYSKWPEKLSGETLNRNHKRN